MTSPLCPCLQDVRTWRYSSLSVSLWWMSIEVWQWVGQVSPCGAVSYRSSGVSGVELFINMQIKSDPSAGGTLSLAEEPKVKLAYIRMIVAIPEDRLFLVVSLVGSQRRPRSCLIGFDFCLWPNIILVLKTPAAHLIIWGKQITCHPLKNEKSKNKTNHLKDSWNFSKSVQFN